MSDDDLVWRLLQQLDRENRPGLPIFGFVGGPWDWEYRDATNTPVEYADDMQIVGHYIWDGVADFYQWIDEPALEGDS